MQLVLALVVTVLGEPITLPTSPNISPSARVPISKPCVDKILTLPLCIR